MQNYISGLLNEEAPPLPVVAAGRETLQLRGGATARESGAPSAVVAVTKKTADSARSPGKTPGASVSVQPKASAGAANGGVNKTAPSGIGRAAPAAAAAKPVAARGTADAHEYTDSDDDDSAGKGRTRR